MQLNLDVDFTSGTALDLDLYTEQLSCDDVSSIAEDSSGFSVATCAEGSGGAFALRFDDVLGTEDVQIIVVSLEVGFFFQSL